MYSVLLSICVSWNDIMYLYLLTLLNIWVKVRDWIYCCVIIRNYKSSKGFKVWETCSKKTGKQWCYTKAGDTCELTWAVRKCKQQEGTYFMAEIPPPPVPYMRGISDRTVQDTRLIQLAPYFWISLPLCHLSFQQQSGTESQTRLKQYFDPLTNPEICFSTS